MHFFSLRWLPNRLLRLSFNALVGWVVMRERKPKIDDQEQADRAFDILAQIMDMHPEIEPNIWVASTLSCIVASFIDAGASYEAFCVEMKAMTEHYKSWWDKEK